MTKFTHIFKYSRLFLNRKPLYLYYDNKPDMDKSTLKEITKIVLLYVKSKYKKGNLNFHISLSKDTKLNNFVKMAMGNKPVRQVDLLNACIIAHTMVTYDENFEDTYKVLIENENITYFLFARHSDTEEPIECSYCTEGEMECETCPGDGTIYSDEEGEYIDCPDCEGETSTCQTCDGNYMSPLTIEVDYDIYLSLEKLDTILKSMRSVETLKDMEESGIDYAYVSRGVVTVEIDNTTVEYADQILKDNGIKLYSDDDDAYVLVSNKSGAPNEIDTDMELRNFFAGLFL